MRRLLTTAILAGILASGAWALVHRDRIQSLDQALSLAARQLGFSADSGGTAKDGQFPIPALQSGSSREVPADRIRVATFNIKTLGAGKAAKPEVMERIVAILAGFDLIAIQEIRNQDQTVMPALVEQLNRASGRRYSFVVSPALGRSGYHREQAAFVFDESRLQIDDVHAAPIQDPEGVMIRPPYIGWFRTAAPRPDQAFTFNAVNIHINAASPELELPLLQEIFRVVRQDGRNEDDVILMGDFNAGERLLAASTERSQLVPVVRGGFTNTRGTRQYDNILFDSLATSEYLGTSGVFDFLKHLNLTMDQALAVSDHLPVWAEFSLIEGGPRAVPPRTANRALSPDFFGR